MSDLPAAFQLDQIRVGPRLRALNHDAVTALAESFQKIGMQSRPVVRREGDHVHLVVGLHRIEAARCLGWAEIECDVFEGSETAAKCWEISENLARAELSAIERAEHVALLVELTRQETGAPQREVERQLNLEHGTVYRAQKIAELPDATKSQAASEGWSQKRLFDTATDKPRNVASDAEPRKKVNNIKDAKAGSQKPRGTALSNTRRSNRDRIGEVLTWLRARLDADELRQLGEMSSGLIDERLTAGLLQAAA